MAGSTEPPAYSATYTGSIITNLPIEPLFMNLIRPVILAKRVSSLPRPTLSPGFTRVPRCRTMIVPPGTTCPPNALNPSRCEFESRPFREVPCPFLCAIKISSQLPVLSSRSVAMTIAAEKSNLTFSWQTSWPPSSERISSSPRSSLASLPLRALRLAQPISPFSASLLSSLPREP
jgi:hypothetical protein